ncbi:TlpA family protein disulfide reductase [Actinokineospora sp.]|uniref:TlpA family protein disulfide reductase n=1 Tax=Actinokineospora sp. TaxID=1872133 RepID=UPI003D6A95F3
MKSRWALVAVILLMAGAVALWPRGEEPKQAAPGPDLTAARAEAALTPCVTAAGGPESVRGVTAECLADGAKVDVAGVLAGRPVLLNVWATWCQPCREELPVLADYAAGEGAIAVVGLAIKSPTADALGLLRDLNVKFPNLLDTDGSVERALKLPAALPASYLVSADGTVTFISDPRLLRSVADVRGAVTRYLGGPR